MVSLVERIEQPRRPAEHDPPPRTTPPMSRPATVASASLSARLAVILAGAGIVIALLAMVRDITGFNLARPEPSPTSQTSAPAQQTSAASPSAVPTSPAPSTGNPTASNPTPVQRVEIVILPGSPSSGSSGSSSDRVSQVALVITSIGTLLAGIGALGALRAVRQGRSQDVRGQNGG